MYEGKAEGVVAKRKQKEFYCTETERWISAFCVSGIMFLVVSLCIYPVFMTIDDARVMYVYAGYCTGQPEGNYLFCYYPIGFIISLLYTYFPTIPWYGFYQFALILFSGAMIGKTIYKFFYQKNLGFIKAVIFHVMLYLSIALISTILMHFEITSTMVGTAGAVLLLGIDFQKDRKVVRRLDFVLSMLCMTACYTIMFNSFYAAFCYVLVVLVVIFLKSLKEKTLKSVAPQILCYLLCAVVCVGGVKMLENHMKDTEEWQGYMSYNKYRVSFWDYPHISYGDNPEFFEEMGWTEEFYEMTQCMYFMDERFNKEDLSQFTQRFSLFSFGTPEEMLDNLTETFRELFEDERLAIFQMVILALLLLVVLARTCSKQMWREYYPEILGMLCCLFGTFILILFLAAKGRLPLRAWLACTIPCISVAAILLIRTINVSQVRREVCTKIKACAGGAVMCLWTIGMFWAYDEIVNQDWQWRNSYNYAALKMEQYVTEHPEKVYVYGLSGAQNYAVFTTYADKETRPTNAFVWGSSYVYTPVYKGQLACNGRTQLLTEDLFDDNVYFIAGDNENLTLFKQMLDKEYENVEMEVVDYISDGYQTDRFVVYKFTK